MIAASAFSTGANDAPNESAITAAAVYNDSLRMVVLLTFPTFQLLVAK
jgi:hypothetical protein